MISKLHLITQDNLKRSHAEQAIEFFKGGGKWVQFRTKKLSEQETIEEAVAIKAAAKEYNAIAILNDNWELAHELKLDGVHVGLTDTPIEIIRSKVKNDFIIGGTSNELKDIQLHYSHGADYIGLGSFRFTSTKEKLSPVLGLNGYKNIIKSARELKISLPIIAIGGIKTEDCQNILSTGIHGVAIASEINLADDPKNQTEIFLENLS